MPDSHYLIEVMRCDLVGIRYIIVAAAGIAAYSHRVG